MMDQNDLLVDEQEGIFDETQQRQNDQDRRASSERRCGLDRRSMQLPYEGPDRRQQDEERRSSWDRRRGPGRRRTDERRSAEEGEMSDEQFEYLKAIEEYKKVNRRPFPSFTEILEIIKAMGYRKVEEAVPISTLKRVED